VAAFHHTVQLARLGHCARLSASHPAGVDDLGATFSEASAWPTSPPSTHAPSRRTRGSSSSPSPAALTRRDVSDVLAQLIVAELRSEPAIARAVDAGLSTAARHLRVELSLSTQPATA
ncbi:MAG: hypothetical protein M3326_14265, partial [Actinomycetota bacterium]|nr:hypothetical protein [Actinomycetota bacterium]